MSSSPSAGSSCSTVPVGVCPAVNVSGFEVTKTGEAEAEFASQHLHGQRWQGLETPGLSPGQGVEGGLWQTAALVPRVTWPWSTTAASCSHELGRNCSLPQFPQSLHHAFALIQQQNGELQASERDYGLAAFKCQWKSNSSK